MTQSKVDFEIEAIERAIRCALPSSRLWLKDVARSLSISPRSLQRHLMGKGTNFSRIVERVREQMACELLERDGANVTEVAEKLGYRDTSNFIRAFRKWTGQTPKKWRTRMRRSVLAGERN